ncbi:two-component system NarL family sensor kinase [Mycobacterium frederiksbergense]|uniref:Two-component system NarL family sensor kinase n=1 Tax=Mycolicibacterium frederiksbergense TaxID=117567 RepID=A0ABT6KW32_9MYCO|nr:ATP-binding protein [Mycolicibacterium frederiksbergense]MDH6194924.1 two-component system NarL family sensor kinase [Mycolicibacterium frederiksbergense]
MVGQDQPAVRLGFALQWALRAVLVGYVGLTLLIQPPESQRWICVLTLVGYVAAFGAWTAWVLGRAARSGGDSHRRIALLMLAADVALVSILSVLTGITSPDSWTSNVLRTGLFLIPLIAAAQLDPYLSGVTAIPTVAAYLGVSWINQAGNEEPWSSILLNATVLTGLAAGSVALSRIQRSKVETIEDLATQRTQLLEDVLGLEKRERQALSERLHDGALQYVLVARGDLEDARTGSSQGFDLVETALKECSALLRDVVRELHPEVLARSGLKAAIAALADSIAARTELVVDLDATTWPEDLRTETDYLLYSAAREFTTNVIKHAQAGAVRIELRREAGQARLRIVDDGVGISEARVAQSVEGGHIGVASIRTKVLACGGQFDVRATGAGTEAAVTVPLSPS